MSDTNVLLEVKGYFGRYLVSDTGDVWSFVSGALRKLKPSYSDGYAQVTLYDEDGGKKQVYVHRIVSEAFLGKCPEGHQVDHIDGNRANNDVMNLRYVTPVVNCKLGASRRGCGSNPNGRCGRRVVAWKDCVVVTFPSTREAARCLHRNQSAVSDCCNGVNHTCAGYRMAFIDEIRLGLVEDFPKEFPEEFLKEWS